MGMLPFGVQIEGHTSDSPKGQEVSFTISKQRATVFASRIAEKMTEHGLASSAADEVRDRGFTQTPEGTTIVKAVGWGSTRRLPGYDDGGNYSENRRVEIKLLLGDEKAEDDAPNPTAEGRERKPPADEQNEVRQQEPGPLATLLLDEETTKGNEEMGMSPPAAAEQVPSRDVEQALPAVEADKGATVEPSPDEEQAVIHVEADKGATVEPSPDEEQAVIRVEADKGATVEPSPDEEQAVIHVEADEGATVEPSPDEEQA
eukprot:3816282-Prymnesium_polylepis.1